MATPTGSCFVSSPVPLLLVMLFCGGLLQLLDAKSLPASELHANGGRREARNLFSFGLPPRGDHVHYYPEVHHHHYKDFGHHEGYPGHHPEHYEPHYGLDFDHNRHHHHHYHHDIHNGHIDTHYF
ncbi:histidine-rich glycoprotein-like [Anopheles aquasalis]|uniref:histidine-rich glycoprotein-like n=1 Tax=Anopheles aquasalis TaxID=42839 RepID=UPI00215A7FF0|nr:histidine-rich glycoprotein-like [Anopheles aquasalis]